MSELAGINDYLLQNEEMESPTEMNEKHVANQNEEQPKTEMVRMIIWSFMLIFSIVLLLVSIYIGVFFDQPYQVMYAQVNMNTTRKSELNLFEATKSKPVGGSWQNVIAIGMIDWASNNNKTNFPSFDHITSYLKGNVSSFDHFIEMASTNKSITIDNTRIQFVDFNYSTTFYKLRDSINKTKFSIMKQGFFMVDDKGKLSRQVRNDGVFRYGDLVQSTPIDDLLKDKTESHVYDPVYYEIIGFDNDYYSQINQEQAQEHLDDLIKETSTHNFYSSGAFYVRSPYGDTTWQSLKSLQMNTTSPFISKYSVRTWQACENYDSDDCTILECKKDMPNELFESYRIDCTQRISLKSSNLKGYPVTKDYDKNWKLFNGDKEVEIRGINVEMLFKPKDGTMTLLQSKDPNGYGFGVIPYICLLNMERSVDIRTDYVCFK